MECLGGAWSIVPCLWGCSDKHVKYIRDLEGNLASLRSERLKLKDLREDVSNRVREAEEQHMKRRNQVKGWLERFEAMEIEVNLILQKGDQELGNKCLGSCCPKNCRSSYKIGKNVVEMIPRVTKLAEEGRFDVVADELPPPPVDEVLTDKLVSLRSAMIKLKNLREDVMNRVREAEEQHMKRTNQVNGWLTSVEAVEKGREELESRCVGSSSSVSSNKLVKEVKEMVSQVTTLMEEGKFDVVAHQLPLPTVDELPMDNVVVGFESKLKELWLSVQNNESHVIGLVGMGGVGKTTLLKQLNNEFLKATHAYDLVIWIVVSKPANLGNIRAAIRSKLSIPDHMWVNKSEDQKNSLVFNILKMKKFVVLLDDIWEGLELSEVGIPQPSTGNMSKIVFTTRSREVCRSMEADKVISVGCLSAAEAFRLFYSKLGEDILKSHPEMQVLIKDVARECEGLPLALVTIGRAMKGKTDARQWKEAKITLEKYSSTFPGMEGVFSKLVFSYDSLPNPVLKKCFEYCSLYPGDHTILVEDVIRLWVAEGFIGENDSMYDALIQGRRILESLKQACLLETSRKKYAYGKHKEAVKMHDVIRDMAFWIACERGGKRNKFYVQVTSDDDHDGIITVAPNAMSNVEKLYLRGSSITTESLAGMSSCPNLTTLIIRKTAAEGLPDETVHSMNALKVLDLSDNDAMALLPIADGCLTNLEYLNIGTCTMVTLPREVSQLIKLRFLIVSDFVIISRGILSSLSALQMFEQVSPPYAGEHIQSERESMEREMLTELDGLKRIMDIRLVLYSAIGIRILLNSPKLQRCTTRLALREVESLPDMLDFGTGTFTWHLEGFRADSCQMSEIKLGRPSLGNDLCEVYFSECNEIKNLSSLIYVPNLSIVHVRGCRSMSELIGEETKSSNVGTSLFSSLRSLTLEELPKLRSICPQDALPFPSLHVLTVKECGSLRKLPFDSNTVSTIPREFVMDGEVDWWNRLEWDSGATRCAFETIFNRLQQQRFHIAVLMTTAIAKKGLEELFNLRF